MRRKCGGGFLLDQGHELAAAHAAAETVQQECPERPRRALHGSLRPAGAPLVSCTLHCDRILSRSVHLHPPRSQHSAPEHAQPWQASVFRELFAAPAPQALVRCHVDVRSSRSTWSRDSSAAVYIYPRSLTQVHLDSLALTHSRLTHSLTQLTCHRHLPAYRTAQKPLVLPTSTARPRITRQLVVADRRESPSIPGELAATHATVRAVHQGGRPSTPAPSKELHPLHGYPNAPPKRPERIPQKVTKKPSLGVQVAWLLHAHVVSIHPHTCSAYAHRNNVALERVCQCSARTAANGHEYYAHLALSSLESGPP